MFKIARHPQFTIPVTILTPTDGGHREETLSVTYRAIPSSEQDKFNLGNGDGTRDFLRAVVVNLDDLQDESGQTVKFSKDLLEQLIDLPWVRLGLSTPYFHAVNKVKTGN